MRCWCRNPGYLDACRVPVAVRKVRELEPDRRPVSFILGEGKRNGAGVSIVSSMRMFMP